MTYLFRKSVSTIVLLASLVLHGCSSINIQADATYLPASIFRDDVKNVLSSYGNEQVLEHSIFRPQFLNYLDSVNRESGPIDVVRLHQAITTWNAVMAESNARIDFEQLHFERLAGLAGDSSYCGALGSCQITAADIREIRKWTHISQHDIIKYEDAGEYESYYDTAVISNVDSNSAELNTLLRRIYKDPVGRNLIEHCIESGVAFRVRKLEGKHGYYNYRENLIVIDPKILSYEFNMRYMIHEMVHAIHHGHDNSIKEEVLAELIGLDAQNRITGIAMELNPYSIFVQHLLHPDYGRLSTSNNIEQSLYRVGLEL